MPPIRCLYSDCVFIEEGYCGAAAIELDPEEGCLTYARAGEEPAEGEEADMWDGEELGDLWHEDDEELYEDADDEEWYEDEENDLD